MNEEQLGEESSLGLFRYLHKTRISFEELINQWQCEPEQARHRAMAISICSD